MTRSRVIPLATALIGLFAASALAQPNEGNAPPQVTNSAFEIQRNLGTSVFGPFAAAVPFDPFTQTASEWDIITASITVTDPDFLDEEQDEIFYRSSGIWVPVPRYESPEGGPIWDTFDDFIPMDDEGFRPPAGQASLVLDITFQVPDFLGRNQARLLNLINFDVHWQILIEITNESGGGEDAIVVPFSFPIFAIENANIPVSNPQAFADAGPDEIVEAGSTVSLNGSRSFDGWNVGFDPFDDGVVDKDELSFAWEWVSGPVKVEPLVRDPIGEPFLAEITLNDVGVYVYRLIVDDGFSSSPPSSDTLVVDVRAAIPENRAPRAEITPPPAAIVVGSVITLDGTRSSDPDGDPLTFRWRQTDELGGTLAIENVPDVFQPLGGLESAISQWQAISAGTYYFRLLVSDGPLQDSERVEVVVIDPGTLGITVERRRAGLPPLAVETVATDTAAPAADPQNSFVPTCGAGLFPMLLAPLALGMLRTRRR